MAVHVRKHWKKYLFGGIAGVFVGRWGVKRYRETVIIRKLCDEAKSYGEGTLNMYDSTRKVYVFLNPAANNSGARYQFNKYAAPLLHLSGADVTVVESDYEGQIRTLLGYIDPSTDAVVVAGGDGTLMEVVNGLLRRGDINVPVGVIPLGKENHFYWSHACSTSKHSSTPARIIGDATMRVIRGNTQPVDVMQIKPERGKVVYAMSGVEWGVFSNAERNRDSFRFFGRLRLFCSYLNTVVKKWPSNFWLTLWLPNSTLPVDQTDNCPVSLDNLSSSQSSILPSQPSTQRQQPRRTAISAASFMNESDTSSVQTLSQAQLHSVNKTMLADGLTDWSQLKHEVVGLQVTAGNCWPASLTMTLWTCGLNKNMFLSHGWKRCFSKSTQLAQGMPCVVYRNTEVVLYPHPRTDSVWFTVDGEPFEAIPICVSVLPHKLNIFI